MLTVFEELPYITTEHTQCNKQYYEYEKKNNKSGKRIIPNGKRTVLKIHGCQELPEQN